jgi:peroxiredoxin
VVTETGADAISSAELLGSGRVVLFAVPGAFTPTCSSVHLPSYVESASELSATGVDRIVCLAVNDPFVLAAWGASQGVGPEITLVSDGNAEFTEAIGMAVDASRAGMGTRSKRYAMVIEDGVVTTFLPEEDGFSAVVSTGQCVVDALKS